MKQVFIYETKIGKVAIAENGIGITDVFLYDNNLTNDMVMEQTERTNEAAKQLKEYLSQERKNFDLVLDPKGTDFQKKVWNSLQKIPYGEISTYKKIAENIENPKASRAVGMANHKNPIMIIIPCHRVVGQNGSLVGYAYGLLLKKQLLNLENYKISSLY